MSVLIKGMEMPNDCNKCQLIDMYNEFCHGANKWLDSEYFVWGMIDEEVLSDKPINCPLIEVPTPHGRLIDADVLAEKAPEIEEYLDVLAPTIIEAEGESCS